MPLWPTSSTTSPYPTQFDHDHANAPAPESTFSVNEQIDILSQLINTMDATRNYDEAALAI